MTPKQADVLDKQLAELTRKEWKLFWHWVTLRYIDIYRSQH